MRIYYVLSNEDIDLSNFIFEAKKFKKSEMEVLFNEDMKNVICEEDYNNEVKKKYCYAFKIEQGSSMIKDISVLFNQLINELNDLKVIFDSGNKRYLNYEEVLYYSKNLIYIGKLFNIEISTFSEYKTEYKTVGLNTLGLEEVKLYLSGEHKDSVYNIFKDVCMNYILDRKFDFFYYHEECIVVDYHDIVDVKLNDFITKQKKKHFEDNYHRFIEVYEFRESNDKFYINDSEINSFDSDLNEVNDYYIQSNMKYDCLNIFYYYKNKRN